MISVGQFLNSLLLPEPLLKGGAAATGRQAPVSPVHIRADAQRGGHVAVGVGDGAAVGTLVSRPYVLNLQANLSGILGSVL